MCMSCGCKQPNEDHGDPRNLTMQSIRSAAQSADISPDLVVKNICEDYQEESQAGDEQFSGPGVRLGSDSGVTKDRALPNG